MTSTKRTRGRPRRFEKGSPTVTILLDKDLKDAVMEYVDDQRIDMSTFVRSLIVNDEHIQKILEEKK